ncbi:MAG TPA: NACHT domain-containing NTPase [Nostocaceae cyanobacterium]|nr:NACHT domain-containing NTPase [Nostocaceae cyanobacterium]
MVKSENQIDIDALVQEMRQKVRDYIKKQCGTMKVLDMTQEIGLDDIYTDVNILENITSRRPPSIAQISEVSKREDFNPFCLNPIREARVPGLEAVERYPKLMIFGKPGAGKTTFLKRIAIQCNSGKFFTNRLPIFITLKAFAEAENQPKLLQYIYNEFSVNDISEQDNIIKILQNGQAIILLDGLDEVREVDDQRVLREIQALTNKYDTNYFIITCRIAAKEYVFEHFKDVEMADFDDKQIKNFVTKWFQNKKPEKAKQFITKIEENERIKELSTNPLLLTFLCWLFSESVDFPENRADLYEQGLDILLRKWDGTRSIERDQVYKKLPTKRKEDLLSEIAFTTFQEGNYFFKQRQLEEYISNYIQNLPDAQTDPEALLVDSRAVLKSIESQHGLFVERARNIYSFSHLTFHEYFTARSIYTSRNQYQELKKLVGHILEPRWQEVFLLIGGMLKEADELVLLMKQEIDKIVAYDEKIQNFLKWLEQKSSSVKSPYKIAAIRAFYLELCLDLDLNIFYKFDPKIVISDCLSLDLRLKLKIYKFLRFIYKFDDHIKRNVEFEKFLSINDLLELVYKFDNVLYLKLQTLKEQLPDISKENIYNFKIWWKINGKNWTDKLRKMIIEHRNISHNWQFNDEQYLLLGDYYLANNFLVNCLKECHLTRSVREEIEQTLLLPIQKN